MNSGDTIAAISTPRGRGGIGIVRLSGENAVEISRRIAHSGDLPVILEPRCAVLAEFVDPDSGMVLDQVVCTYFRKPHSYTAEDVVELACHGSPVVVARLLQCCLDEGARIADPGEFTMRAFLSGRIDLTQAEAVHDLIEARTLFQARVAAQQVEGSVALRIHPHKKKLVDLIALLEAGIDFAEDDVSVLGWREIARYITTSIKDLEELCESFTLGRLVHEGLSLVVVGRPNVGKSSLFNSLLNQDRAIVTATPGTTRDLVTESTEIEGVPLRFIDTAGVRTTHEEAELIGVQKSLGAIADSDLTLVVLDGSEVLTSRDRDLFQRVVPLGRMLVAINKADLPERFCEADVRELCGSSGADPEFCKSFSVVRTSALTSKGIGDLKKQILSSVIPLRELEGVDQCITNLRHQQLIRDLLDALRKAHAAAESKIPHEMVLIDLYNGLRALDSITGQTTTDDILGVVFSQFCVGK